MTQQTTNRRLHPTTRPTPSRYTTLDGLTHGGDFVNQERSQWDPETLREAPYDSARVAQLFADANAAAAES